jgi:hypothetical protein
MAKGFHKGTELSNVSQTWDQNERERGQESSAESVPAASELDRMVSEEAREYDNSTAEDNLLTGERATVRDDEDESRNPDS